MSGRVELNHGQQMHHSDPINTYKEYGQNEFRLIFAKEICKKTNAT
jgi:hypothetical protein